MTSRILLAVLFLATSASATITFDPPVGMSDRPVVALINVSWVHICGPDNVLVERKDDHTFFVTVVVPARPECLPTFPGFGARTITANLFPSPPGVYEVVVRMANPNSVTEVERATLFIRDAEAPFTVEPEVLLTKPEPMRELLLHWRLPHRFCDETSDCQPQILIGGRNAERFDVLDDRTILVRVPDLADGTYDVQVRSAGASIAIGPYTARAAVTVAANPPPELLERVLVPLLFHGPGAAGSEWTTDVWIHNDNPYEVMSTDGRLRWCEPLTNPCYLGPLASGGTQPFSAQYGVPAPNGFVLFVPRGSAGALRGNARVRDLSRQAEALGAELPIAKEDDFSTGSLSFGSVPLDPRFRVALRIYGTTGGSVRVRFLIGRGVVAEGTVSLRQGESADVPPTSFINDVVQRFPQLAGRNPVRIEVYGFGEPVWAFASVTNNATQHVTNISPQ